eukprot:5293893-Prymnesium_polylepis.1
MRRRNQSSRAEQNVLPRCSVDSSSNSPTPVREWLLAARRVERVRAAQSCGFLKSPHELRRSSLYTELFAEGTQLRPPLKKRLLCESLELYRKAVQ